MESAYAKLAHIIHRDLGNAGIEYLELKKNKLGIDKFDYLHEYEQQRFITGLVHDLYSDMISHKRYRDILFAIFNELYGFSEAEYATLWKDFFKGCPPVGFLYHFFGPDIGNRLRKIEEGRGGIIKITHEEDAVQFSFVMGLISRMFKDYYHLKEDLTSIFMKYLMKGPDKSSIRFNDFIRKNVEDADKVAYSIKSFLIDSVSESNAHEVEGLFGMTDYIRDKKTIPLDLKTIEDNESAYIFKNLDKAIEKELGRYISSIESRKIIIEAKKKAGINSLANANDDEKAKFMKYILNHSAIMSFSDQKERMVKQWMKRLLRI